MNNRLDRNGNYIRKDNAGNTYHIPPIYIADFDTSLNKVHRAIWLSDEWQNNLNEFNKKFQKYSKVVEY